MKKKCRSRPICAAFLGNVVFASAYHNTGSVGTRDDARIATRSVLVSVHITKGHGGRFDIRLVDHNDNATAESAARALQDIAQQQDDADSDRFARITVALQALHTANSAVQALQ